MRDLLRYIYRDDTGHSTTNDNKEGRVDKGR